MQRIHCDYCDKAIPDSEVRWTLRVGIAKGEKSTADAEPRDFCERCIHSKAQAIVLAVLAEPGWAV